MRNFSRPLTVLRGLALLATASVYTLAYAEINLGVLSECKDIARVVNELKKGALPAADECKLPQRNLEYTLMQRAGGKQSKLCLLKSTSVDLLSDFACFRYSTPANGAMTCFRRARLKDITAYKQDYERKGATMVQDYLAAASQCKVSNGNSSVTPYVAFPKVLTFIAKFEFGFTTFIGDGRKTDSIIQHGYARTDASITSDIPDAIEYISFNISPTQKQSAVNEKKIGKWTIEIKKHDDYDKEINSELRKKHLRLLIQSIDYDLEKQSETDIPITKKIAILDDIQKNISSSLINEKFTLIRDEDFTKIGLTRKKIIEEADKKMAFGVDKRNQIQVGENILMVFNTHQPACTEKNSGAVAVYSFLVLPMKDVASDFGSVMLTFTGIDNCSDSLRSDVQDYLARLNEVIKKKIFLVLQSH